MNCPYCHTENSPDSLFCRKCGKELPQLYYCPRCGAKLDGPQEFCHKCGTSILVTAAQEQDCRRQQEALEEKRQTVAALRTSLEAARCAAEERAASLKELTAGTDAKSAQVDELARVLAERQQAIASRESALQAAEDALSAGRAQLAERQAALEAALAAQAQAQAEARAKAEAEARARAQEEARAAEAARAREEEERRARAAAEAKAAEEAARAKAEAEAETAAVPETTPQAEILPPETVEASAETPVEKPSKKPAKAKKSKAGGIFAAVLVLALAAAAVWLLRQPAVLPDTDEQDPVVEQNLPTLTESVVPGSTITFGHYEQDNDTANGPEAITWKVLACEDGTALLVSERVLDYMPYDTNGSVRWDTSSLRAELNGAFYDSAFSDEEKAVMVTSQVTPYDDPVTGVKDDSAVTEDMVFILSLKQANDYFQDALARVAWGTAYAVAHAREQAAAQGETLAEDFGGSAKPGTDWLLRTPGQDGGTVTIARDTWYYTTEDFGRVTNGGYCFRDGDVTDYRTGVRPCIRVRIPAADTADTVGDLSSAQVGDLITIGRYEQDNDLDNGPEAIQWRVLDKKDGRLLVISDRVLDYVVNCYDWYPVENPVWATSCARGWLNNYFMQMAFTPAEQARIALSDIHTDPSPGFDNDPGPDTQDYVFFLSAQETEQYFPTAESRRVFLSDYVHPHNKIRVNRQGWGTNTTRLHGDWMLRSPSKDGGFAYILDYQTIYWTAGDIWYDAVGFEGDARPAMWITVAPDGAPADTSDSPDVIPAENTTQVTEPEVTAPAEATPSVPALTFKRFLNTDENGVALTGGTCEVDGENVVLHIRYTLPEGGRNYSVFDPPDGDTFMRMGYISADDGQFDAYIPRDEFCSVSTVTVMAYVSDDQRNGWTINDLASIQAAVRAAE